MNTTSRIDGLESTLGIKAPVRVATIANITLSGLQVIDGVTLLGGDRVLVCNQSLGFENGIYIADAGNWGRAADWNGARDAVKGTRIFVTDGATNGNKIFYVTTNDPFVIGQTSVFFADEDTSGFDAISPISQLGDVIYGGNGGVSQRLSGNTSSDRKFLSQTGDGSNSAAPSWQGIATSDLPIVPIAKGGTGETSKTAAFDALAPSTTKGDLIVYNGTDNVRVGVGADGAVLVASSSAPAGVAWDTVAGGSSVFDDSTFRIQDNSDSSKRMAFELSDISTGSTRTFTVPNANDTIVGATAAQTLTNKTLIAPVISTISNSGTLTLPTSTDTLVGRATTDTLTNKTLASPTITGGTVNASVLQVGGVDVLTAASIELDDLNNVDTTGATVHGANYTLEYSSVSGGYTLDTVTGSGEVNTASNVGSSGVGLFKTKSGTDLQFKNIVAGSNITVTGGTNEITITGAASGTGGGGASSLDDLSDVIVSSPSTGQLLRYNGTAWVNVTAATSVYLNVKDFGAIGDGVADDTSALQSAFNAVAASGGVLYFPKGKYRITSQIVLTTQHTVDKDGKHAGLLGDGLAASVIVWDGSNTGGATPAVVVQCTNTTGGGVEFQNYYLSFVRDIGITNAAGKGGWASGWLFKNLAFFDVSNVASTGMHRGIRLENVISSRFSRLYLRNNNYGGDSIGFSGSVLWNNNALVFDSCVVGNNNLGGFEFTDTHFTWIGGSIESNASLASAGQGYGARIYDTRQDSPIACTFIGTYLELNGTTGNSGVNASRADVHIIHSNTNDNVTYNFFGCSFGRINTNYAPHGILIEKTSTTAATLNVQGCVFTDYNSYTPDASRRYIGVQGSQAWQTMNINALGNYYNRPEELPLFLIDNSATLPVKNSVDFVRVKNFSSLLTKNSTQSISSASDVALSWNITTLNDGVMFNGGLPTRLTVPNGVKRVRLMGGIRCNPFSASGALLQIFMRKNGSAFNGAPYQNIPINSGTYNFSCSVVTPVIPVTSGDYFELFIRQNTGSTITVLNDPSTYFSMEVVE